jgi:hypothetical protein
MPLDFADEALWPIARPASANRKPRGIVTIPMFVYYPIEPYTDTVIISG